MWSDAPPDAVWAGSEPLATVIAVDGDGFIVPPPGLIPPRRDADQATRRAPERAPLPAFHATGPGQTPAAPPPSEPHRPSPNWTLVLPGGSATAVDGPALLGRNPSATPPWEAATLVVVDDPARSVSKTHAALEPVGERLRVVDLHSTNGVTVVRADGSRSELAAGVPADVGSGVTLLLGTFAVRVERS